MPSTTCQSNQAYTLKLHANSEKMLNDITNFTKISNASRTHCGLVGLLTTLFHITLTHQRKTVIMLRLATHTNDVPAFSSPAFSTPAIWSHVFQSRVFHPCNLVPRFPLPHFPPLWFGPLLSSPAFSTPVNFMVPRFPVPCFQRPLYMI